MESEPLAGRSGPADRPGTKASGTGQKCQLGRAAWRQGLFLRLSRRKRCRRATGACPPGLTRRNVQDHEKGVNTSGSTSGTTPGPPVQATVQATFGATPSCATEAGLPAQSEPVAYQRPRLERHTVDARSDAGTGRGTSQVASADHPEGDPPHRRAPPGLRRPKPALFPVIGLRVGHLTRRRPIAARPARVTLRPRGCSSSNRRAAWARPTRSDCQWRLGHL